VRQTCAVAARPALRVRQVAAAIVPRPTPPRRWARADRPAQDPGAGAVAEGVDQQGGQQAQAQRDPDHSDQRQHGQDGEPENSSRPSPIEGPIRVRPASRILAAPRPTSHTSTSPTTRVDADTASHQPKRPTQPKPFQLVLVCRRLVVPLIVAPDATTGLLWETTSPVTLAPLCSSTLSVEHHHVAVDPLGDGHRSVKGGQRPVDGAGQGHRAVERDQVADLLALGHVGAAGQNHERLAGLPTLRPGGRRHPSIRTRKSAQPSICPWQSLRCLPSCFRSDRPPAHPFSLARRSGRSASWVWTHQATCGSAMSRST
jgi:hypothetical protein